jgi:glycosyltransferase involved in cell wall biosynthesis
VIAVVANVIPRKGQVYALRALPTVLKTAPTAQLLLVGDEDQNYLRRVLSVADALNVGAHVHRLGRRSDIPELLAASDIFMLPSLEEALPLSILEAMAAGLPTVATTVGGNSECVLPGETGLLVPPRDPQALANAVLEMLGDRQWLLRMGSNARQHCMNRFSIDRQTAAIEAVFEQVIGGHRSARAA